MTTKTETTVTETEADLEQRLNAAAADLAERRQHREEYRGRIHSLRANLLGRQIDAPEEFDDTGQPKPETPAAELASEIHQLAVADNLDQVVAGAEARLSKAEQALLDHRNRQARELFDEMVPEAIKKHDAYVQWAAGGREFFRDLLEVGSRAAALAHTSGLYGSGDVSDYGHEHAALAMIEQTPPLPLPREFVAETEAETDE